jgi:secondary thiamine-phosphate synthase enzyme
VKRIEMMAALKTFSVSTSSRNEFIDITSLIQEHIKKSGIKDGVCILHVPHTTAALTINENADPSVQDDILRQLSSVIPENGHYRHSEGNSDAHIKASLFGPSLTLLIEKGRIVLGTWQGIYFCEFDGPRRRNLIAKIIPD